MEPLLMSLTVVIKPSRICSCSDMTCMNSTSFRVQVSEIILALLSSCAAIASYYSMHIYGLLVIPPLKLVKGKTTGCNLIKSVQERVVNLNNFSSVVASNFRWLTYYVRVWVSRHDKSCSPPLHCL